MKSKNKNIPFASAENLLNPLLACHALIQDALHRCKESQVATRITVTLTKFAMTDRDDHVCRISVADTGCGVSRDMFGDFFPYKARGITAEFESTNVIWDGVLYITTTCLDEQIIRNYEIKIGVHDFKHKIVQSNEQSKHTSFRGTEISILLEGNPINLQKYVQDLCEKMTILNLQDVFVEFCEETLNPHDKRQTNCLSLCDGGRKVDEFSSTLDLMCLGLEDYTFKYIYKSIRRSGHLNELMRDIRFGKAETISQAGSNKREWTLQACLILIVKEIQGKEMMNSEAERPLQTQITFFDNHYLHSQIPKSALRALSRVDWSKIGLRIKKRSIQFCNQAPSGVIVWDQYPKDIERLDLVLHRVGRSSSQTLYRGEYTVTKKTIEAALNDLKYNCPQILSTPHESRVSSKVPKKKTLRKIVQASSTCLRANWVI
ncbi:hypothetical protein MPTK1_7g02230 [Marchantia polymorpha subsp. ruderalis]|uniref:Uncharacterized protein n=2 Tax=Marchantia polymorpha TaxID=3197 RepID=A0AAF6BVB8_MARPO|nr:hypothetical protein MARPO_0088s0064 [Marchantia polymorpha]PTQ33520.1 hypothetical protein MARPO_0088s0064 [Marchantia polymorpha]BBN15952.1 hypothetical protein Mp_7g02230 [Marchantia polymorpha subsp. ruderalis]BBN15953.1 hypothetical protein Mp_7g02230 [Marchantia polymorpha subsp. ruderalis]|eukprot:PTQ33519.1 hypothetical protein MARPO_0088s0064 [Marchantia polymorpha]